MTVGETSATSPEDAKLWAGYHTGELNMIFHFDHMGVDNDPNGNLGGKVVLRTVQADRAQAHPERLADHPGG